MDEYCASSGFEAVIGFHYLEKKFQRLKEIIDFSIETIERQE